MNQQATPINQLQNNVTNQPDQNENQVVNDILNEISQDQQMSNQEIPQQNIQQTMQEVPQQMQQMNYNTDPNVQQMPQHLNPQGSQTDFGQFLQSKGYQSVPFTTDFIRSKKSISCVCYLLFSQNFLQKMIVGLSKNLNRSRRCFYNGIILVSLLLVFLLGC